MKTMTESQYHATLDHIAIGKTVSATVGSIALICGVLATTGIAGFTYGVATAASGGVYLLLHRREQRVMRRGW